MTGRTIAELVSHLNRLDVQLVVEETDAASGDTMRLRCSAPEGVLTVELRQELGARKAELVDYLQRRALAKEIDVDHGQQDRGIAPNEFSLSFAQQRLWFMYQLAPNSPFYNIPAAIRLTGTLDRSALERSFQDIVRRHAALRTRFAMTEGQPVQRIESHVEVALTVVDLQAVAANDRDRISQQLATTEAQRPFNLETDSPLRLTLLQFQPLESVLLLTMHHIVADGWSLGVLIQELADCYTAFVEGRSPTLPPLTMQYTDFALWQRNWLQGEVLEKQLSYWRKQLHDLPVLELPSDRPHPAAQTYRGATVPLHIPLTLTQALETLSQEFGVSLYMTLLAAVQTLLYRYTGQEDMAIGSPIANRHRSEVEGLIGFFVNTLVLRSDLSGNPTFRELLERVRDVALEAYEHQDLPFEKLVEELDPDRNLSRNPLFQVALALQNAPMQILELPELTLEATPLESGSTRFDLEIHLWEPNHGLRSLWQSQDGLSGFISYSTDLFDRDRIVRLVGHFQTLLDGIVANPNVRLSELPLLTNIEYQNVLTEWSRSPVDQPERSPAVSLTEGRELCFHQIVEAHAKQFPDAIALVSEQETLTYAELEQRANRLAITLQQMGVYSGSLIGLCVERSAEMVIGILGILKVGGVYVPLDPNYPSDRLHFMLTDTQLAVLLTQSELVESLPESSAHVVCLDQVDLTGVVQGEDPQTGWSSNLDSPAYVIYTSGSTGTPKGVLLSHRGLSNVLAAQQHCFPLPHSSRVLQFSSLSFDASVFEITLALGSGSTLYIPPRSAQLPGMALMEFLQHNAITHALLTPAVLAVLPAVDLPALQVLITGGEACSSAVVDRWAVHRRFFNAYGPTETTIWATIAEFSPGASPHVIGRPISNTHVYILDNHLNPVPAGVPGELYIGGVGLAVGYLHRPELTAERFIQSPFQQESRLYKTGDRAQYCSDGTLEFLGRLDSQIKIRGFRVELGEVEATLQRHLAIQDAVVIASEESSYERRLIAYFSLDRQYSEQRARRSLQNQHLHHWQTLYDQTYDSPADAVPQFNITGWNSSYTGEPIPLEEMQEWVGDRVQQILALKPKRVLEIGCGTGLLLFQIAPHCETYVGTDFSQVSLESIQSQLMALDLSQVKLLHRTADDFEGIDRASFDVVILNSIVQYFPSADYLMQVLERAIQAVTPGGVVFVGDVRNLPLLRAFHAWMNFNQVDAGMERTQLRHRAERSQFEEPELAIDPALFHGLRDRFPHIQQVQIRLSRGHHSNEMTQFRYNVLLRIEGSPSAGDEPDRAFSPDLHEDACNDWNVGPSSVTEVKQYLVDQEPEVFIVRHVANSRVSAAVRVANWLRNQTLPKTVGRMREMLRDTDELAIDPQDWWDLETVLPYKVEISWSTQVQRGEYDVLFIRHGVNPTLDGFPYSNQHSDRYTNNPLQSNVARQLIPELQHDLRQTLPDYMVPSVFIPLEALPLNSSGKIDRRALPPLQDVSLSAPTTTPIPLSPTQERLVDIWKELLRLKNLSIHDNFFELGGHSLLATQMTSRIRDVLRLELPLRRVFEAPTIAQLAPILEHLQDTASTPVIPPLVRLDRSAHRRKRLPTPSDSASSPLFKDQSTFSTHVASSTYHPTATPQPSTFQQPKDISLTEDSAAQSVEDTSAVRSPLIPLTLGSNKQPFFCVHPMFGVVFPYLELAHQLGSDRSFYGLQPLGLDGTVPPLNRIEAIATYYIQAIRSLQPQGPYLLGGWSFGGLVAFEMAQQLTQAGQSVELLAILDTPAPSHNLSFSQSLKFLLGTALWSTLPFLVDYVTLASHRLPAWNSWLSRGQWSAFASNTAFRAIARLLPEEARLPLLDESAVRSLLPIVYANSQAAYRYAPQPYPHTLTLFKAVEQPDSLKHEFTLGWDNLANNVQLYEVPGNHLSLLKQPHVQTLAQSLGQCLSRTPKSVASE